MEAAIADNPIIKEVPSQINDSEILDFLFTKDINWKYVDAMTVATNFPDAVLSDWLNVSVATFWEFKKPGTRLKENVKEQVLLLLSLIKHGSSVFGTALLFNEWMNRENFFFDKKAPKTFLNTITGIKFINNQLTAIEYGDNV